MKITFLGHASLGIALGDIHILVDPFIINHILFKRYAHKEELEREIEKFNGSELSVDSIKTVLKAIKNKDNVPKRLEQLIFDVTEIIMKDRIVILKRDPVLHDWGMRGMYQKLISSNTIGLSTLNTGGFNADFDGDQLSVYHQLTIA